MGNAAPEAEAPPAQDAVDGHKFRGFSGREALFAADTAFYMNFKVLNLDEALPKILKEKLEAMGKGKSVQGVAGGIASMLAHNARFAQLVANKIGDTLVEQMPAKLDEMGIHFNMTKVFNDAKGFVVVRAEIETIDLEVLLKSKLSKQMGAVLTPLLGVSRWFVDVDAKVKPILQNQMVSALEDMMPEELEKASGMRLFMVNKPSAEQADFFFGAIGSHHMDVILTVADLATLAPKLLEMVRGEHKGASRFAVAFGTSVAKHARSPERIFERAAPGVFAHCLSAWLAERGVCCELTDSFVCSQGGRVVLRAVISDVNLPALIVKRREHPVFAEFPELPDDQQFLRFGHDGRQRVYCAIRALIAADFSGCLAEHAAAAGVVVSVTDSLASNITPTMVDVDVLPEDEAA